MNKINLASALVTFTFLLSLGCGVSSSNDNSGDKNNGQNGSATADFVNFNCNNLTCNSASQYCLLTQNRMGDIYYTSCATIPTNVKANCDWAQNDAVVTQLHNVENCKHAMICSNTGTQITVTCIASAAAPLGR